MARTYVDQIACDLCEHTVDIPRDWEEIWDGVHPIDRWGSEYIGGDVCPICAGQIRDAVAYAINDAINAISLNKHLA